MYFLDSLPLSVWSEWLFDVKIYNKTSHYLEEEELGAEEKEKGEAKREGRRHNSKGGGKVERWVIVNKGKVKGREWHKT